MSFSTERAFDSSEDESDGSVFSFEAPSSKGSSIPTEFSRSSSPALSVRSMTSSLRASAYKEEFGRIVNAYSDVYRLPADEQELARLDRQHVLLMKLMHKYPPPLNEVMTDDPATDPKAALDLGCGSGAWIMDVARDFPLSSCVAVDLVPMNSLYMPSNCRSEMDDINLGLEHFYSAFDVVQCRLIAAGIRDYPHLIQQISHVLRPGGLFIAIDCDYKLYNERKEPRDDSCSGSFSQWVDHFRDSLQQLGGSPDAATTIPSEIKHHSAFEEVSHREYWVPVSPWEGSFCNEESRQAAKEMRTNIMTFMKSGRLAILGMGMNATTLDLLEETAQRELLECTARFYVRITSVYCRKRRPRSTSS